MNGSNPSCAVVSLCQGCGVPVPGRRRHCQLHGYRGYTAYTRDGARGGAGGRKPAAESLGHRRRDTTIEKIDILDPGGSCRQIAEVLEMSPMSVFDLVHSALKSLRALPESHDLYCEMASAPELLARLLRPPNLKPLLRKLRKGDAIREDAALEEAERWLMLADLMELELPEDAAWVRQEAARAMGFLKAETLKR